MKSVNLGRLETKLLLKLKKEINWRSN